MKAAAAVFHAVLSGGVASELAANVRAHDLLQMPIKFVSELGIFGERIENIHRPGYIVHHWAMNIHWRQHGRALQAKILLHQLREYDMTHR